MMSAEQVETRLARAEERLYSHDARLNGIDKRVDTLTPLLSDVATLNERVRATHVDIKEMRSDFANWRERQEQRDEDERDDRKQFNRWAIGIGVMVIIGLLSFAGVLISGAHP